MSPTRASRPAVSSAVLSSPVPGPPVVRPAGWPSGPGVSGTVTSASAVLMSPFCAGRRDVAPGVRPGTRRTPDVWPGTRRSADQRLDRGGQLRQGALGAGKEHAGLGVHIELVVDARVAVSH